MKKKPENNHSVADAFIESTDAAVIQQTQRDIKSARDTRATWLTFTGVSLALVAMAPNVVDWMTYPEGSAELDSIRQRSVVTDIFNEQVEAQLSEGTKTLEFKDIDLESAEVQDRIKQKIQQAEDSKEMSKDMFKILFSLTALGFGIGATSAHFKLKKAEKKQKKMQTPKVG